jgi:enolase-phosphatase E1
VGGEVHGRPHRLGVPDVRRAGVGGRRLSAVVLDIEGTTSSTAFVYDTLYPYARARLAGWVAAHPDDPWVTQVPGDVATTLTRWSDADEKVTALKAIQGRIWDEGFAAGELTSHFYPDAVPALRRWHGAGRRLYVFSSGSVTAQQGWFGHSPDGDLRDLIAGWFDTETAGPKKEPDSYRRIGRAIGEVPVFLSDVTAELDAARAAGWATVGVRRRGDRWYDAGVGGHPEVASFDEVDALLP